MSRGICTYCGQEFGKTAIKRHLTVCPQRMNVILQAESGKGTRETLIHLRVQAAYAKEFWLDLEMRGSATLKDLDTYLRAIWLECCGHLSAFSSWKRQIRRQKSLCGTKQSEIFTPGTLLTHLYDFGSTSETQIEAVEIREGKPTTSRPIALLARNVMPEAECIECDQKAVWLCMECVIEEDAAGTLCEKHVKKHRHKNYGEPVSAGQFAAYGSLRLRRPR